jgi:hypothetical protein
VSSPYRIPDPPRRPEPELDVSPAVVVLTVAAIVAIVLLSREAPASSHMDGVLCGHIGAHAGAVARHR